MILIICMPAHSIKRNNLTQKKVFNYLVSRNDIWPELGKYNKNKNSIFIYDLHTKKNQIREKSICVFGINSEEQNYYLFFKNGSNIEFVNPAETKLEVAIRRLHVIFKNKFPYKYDLIIKDITDFYEGNHNSLIFVNPVPASEPKPEPISK